MKQFKTLFILLIGMISFTATAHAAKLEQKPQCDLVQEHQFQINDVNFDFSYQIVSDEVTNEALIFRANERKDIVKHLAFVTDVGWSENQYISHDTFYKEKLIDNYNLNFKHRLNYPYHLKE